MRLFLPLTVLALLAACGGDTAAPVASAPAAPPVVPAPAAPEAPPAAPATQFTCCAAEGDTKVVSDYLAVQAALAKDDDAAAVVALTALEQDAGSAQEIVTEAKATHAATDIAARRTALKKLSAAVIPYAKAHTGGTLAITEAYCPMADASWLQAGNTIANPYYGSSMLTCGSFK